MTIIYCTQIYFLDAAIEYVRLIASQGYKVHVAIELSPNQLKTNILDIETDLNKFAPLTSFEEVVDTWGLHYLKPFFTECISVNFVIYPSKKILQTRKVARELGKYINEIRPDYIHLDDFSSRTLFQLSFLIKYRKILIANIHDPLTHSGEFNLSREIYRKLWFNLIPSFVVFSEFSKTVLRPQINRNKKITVLKLMPYTVYKSFASISSESILKPKKYISFVGRISPYKGVDLFIEAIDVVSKRYPEIQFFIGGKTIANYDPEFLNRKCDNIIIENKFLSNSEISDIINDSQLIVCPYKDATQSGVIMTAQALNCPVLVTPVGGLPEYIESGKSGLVSKDVSVNSLSEGLLDFIQGNQYKNMCQYLKGNVVHNMIIDYNLKGIHEIYSS